MHVLVVFPDSVPYAELLAERFPSLVIQGAPTFADARAYLADTQILITTGRGLDADTAREMPEFRWIHCPISGTDQLAVAREAGPLVPVTSSSGIHGPEMAEMAVLHMLALSRQLVRLERQRQGRQWVSVPQRVLDQNSAGIVRRGAVGTRPAQLCKAFNMTVYGVSRTPRSDVCFDQVFDRHELGHVASLVDFLVLTVPLSDDTFHPVDKTILAAMNPSAAA